ncbi:HlyD family efflux transporter periplasmic adaptor subunit [Ramlibacter sp. USB13]|uniref:HlyD family efflux transporter periplasmic adaptor subunit n=1 Tax=Ramlibacter cellulosilyticus TaxID=2764187 RepID=A0A923MTC0_9BURK|nr:HlyD family efflux transporter periplasmic adaptor subunit [Ramlibacter cellulosilyticus]MBC5785462.1 HlyD family efflux transporter periplasmic adaptor subunit [Ramlibacter cellulosilyticus]
MSGASIYSLADTQAKQESAAWARFSAPGSLSEFCAGWLAILCGQVDRVAGALVLLGEDGEYSPVASWPDASHNLRHLAPLAESTLQQRRGVVEEGAAAQPGAASTLIGYPVEVDGFLHGAVVMEIRPRPEAEVQRALRLLHWGSAWLVAEFRQRAALRVEARAQRLEVAQEVLATAMQDAGLRASALAVANDLAGRLGCERVAIGLVRHDRCEVEAISHTATFDRRTDFVRLLAEAMEEVPDLGQSFVHPPLAADAVGGLAHATLSASRGDVSVLSVPLADDNDTVGVLTLERRREQPFGAEDLLLCEAAGELLGPVFAMKRRAEMPWTERTVGAWRRGATMLFGPRHPGLKLVALVVLAVATVLALATTQYRVASKVAIEGAVQRSIVAPFQGYVAESHVRAGESVRAGQVLARLDDRDLRLERARWLAEAEQMARRYRQAAATSDRAAMAISSAQEEQARAQLALVEERLARSTLSAPFDGLVVVGDLSQLLGSPVEQGKVLFEVAPLDRYRVILNVDERDIGEVAVGQRGEIALAGMPYERLPFTVRNVTPVSTAQDGHNFFRVEAQLDSASVRLRPGMEGVGKIEVGERKLLWTWTHTFVEWVQLALWRWVT